MDRAKETFAQGFWKLCTKDKFWIGISKFLGKDVETFVQGCRILKLACACVVTAANGLHVSKCSGIMSFLFKNWSICPNNGGPGVFFEGFPSPVGQILESLHLRHKLPQNNYFHWFLRFVWTWDEAIEFGWDCLFFVAFYIRTYVHFFLFLWFVCLFGKRRSHPQGFSRGAG